MFNKLSKLWLRGAWFFDPIQHFFNGSFWPETKSHFEKYFQGRLLDLACGTGELIDHIHPQEYLGVDFNQQYIQFAQKHRQRHHVNFVHADITKIDFGDNFDTAIIISATHHLRDKQLIEIFQTLQRKRLKKLLIIDGLPRTPFAGFLEYLDSRLGGGSYFRSEDQLAEILSPYFRVLKKGRFNAKRSFYIYPYLVATAIKP